MKTKIISVFTVALFAYNSLLGGQMRTLDESKPARQVVLPGMPNLSGDAAKEYLEKEGLYASLADAAKKQKQPAQEPADSFSQVKRITSDVPGAGSPQFGTSVALDGNTAIVGAYLEGCNPPHCLEAPGAAYVFERNTDGANNWGQVKRLIPPDSTQYDLFGASVDIDGDTAIVGSPEQRAIYVFERNAGGANNWGFVKKITAGMPLGWLARGIPRVIAIDGDLIVGGAPGEDGTSPQQGAVYIFERNSGGEDQWGEIKRVTASDAAFNDRFGSAVGIDGETIIVSAPYKTVGDNSRQGSAYIFERDAGGGVGNWGETAKVVAADGGEGDQFSFVAVSVDGDIAAVGAPFDTVNGNMTQGSAYIFYRNAGHWGQVKKITALAGESDEFFGYSVSLSGDKLLVSSPNADAGAATNAGAAFVFEKNAGGADNWGQTKKLTALVPQQNGIFGLSAALDNKTAIAGAIGENGPNGEPEQGSAYIFQTQNTAWVEDSNSPPANCTVDGKFGSSISISGDIAIVGAPNVDVGTNANQGAAFIFQKDQGGANAWGLLKFLVSSDGAADSNFGWSVSISGDTAVVAARAQNEDQGAAYVFERNAGGTNNWGETRKITASDGSANDRFGTSVSINGDRIVIGAAGNNSQGAAYIFERNQGGANNWGEVKKIVSSDGVLQDRFGNSVAVSGNTIIVGAEGAEGDDDEYTDQGAGYVFERDAGGSNNWGEIKKLAALDGAALQQFGHSVAIGGDTIAIGANNDNGNGGANFQQGSAYLYGRDIGGANNWGLVKQLAASDAGTSRYFGSSIGIDGDTLIVGSSCGSPVGGTCQGSAYIFRQNAGGADNWGETKKLLASDRKPYDYFGTSVAVAGGVAISGAPDYDLNSLNDINGIGAVYVFTDTGTDWIERAKQLPPPPTNCGTADQYGYSVAIDGDIAVTGAPFDDIGISENQGSVYIFERNQGGANNWGLVKILIAADGAAGDEFGTSVAISGNRIVVGAHFDDVGTNNAQGSAYVFERNHGGLNNWGEIKKLKASDGGGFDAFGNSVGISGNTIVVGASSDTITNLDQGSAYIFERNFGGANNWGEIKKLSKALGASSENFGHSVAIGNDTVIIGMWNSPDDEDEVYIYGRDQGGANNWGQVKLLTPPETDHNQLYGFSVALDGNTAIVGAPASDFGGNQNQGAAYVYGRDVVGSNSWGEVGRITASDGAADDWFGYSVGIRGDAAIVGAYLDNVGATDQGSAYIFEQNAGGADNWGQVQKITASDGTENDRFGHAVAVSGDNFIVGAPNQIPAGFSKIKNSSVGGNNQGAGYIFRGSPPLAPTAAFVSISGSVRTAYGAGIRSAVVTLVSSDGTTRTVRTGTFGHFRFDNVEAGQTYILTVTSKRYTFAESTRVLNVTDNISELDFTAQP